MIGDIVTVTVDRPMGTYHPKHKDIYYSINYGYVKGILVEDGEEQDAYIVGVEEPLNEFNGEVIAIIYRKNDVEDKWVVSPKGMKFTVSEIKELVYFQEKYFDFEIIT